MEKIIKIYIDIECPYMGDIPKDDRRMFRDYTNWGLSNYGIFSALGIEIDPDEKTCKELWFYQRYEPTETELDDYFGLKSDTKSYCPTPLKNIMKLGGYGYTEDSNWNVFMWRRTENIMPVTFNGRRFDFPIIIQSGKEKTEKTTAVKTEIMKKVLNKDRDLQDICLKRGIPIKGGLSKVTENFGIDNPYNQKMDDAMEALLYNGYNKKLKETNKKEYYSQLQLVGEKNKADIKLLPKLEEKLGILYLPRSDEDKYKHNWK